MVAVATATPAAAGPVDSPELTYECQFPLIGSKPITFIAHSNLPDFQTGGTYSLDITAEATVAKESAQGLWAAKAQTLQGTAVAHATLFTPDHPGGQDVTTTVNLPSTPITGPPVPAGPNGVALPGPEPTDGFKINGIKGTSPTVTAGPTAGWGQITVENLELTLKPLDYLGNETSLGEFKATCWLLPSNKTNVLGQAWLSDGSTPQTPKPEPFSTYPQQGRTTATGATFPPNRKALTNPLKFVCAIGLGIGSPTIPVKMEIDYPAEAPTHTRMPPITIPISAHIDANTTNGIGALGGYFIEGTAYSNNVIRTPDYPNGVRAQTIAKLKKTPVPQSPDGGVTLPDPFDLEGTATAPALAFASPGQGSITIGDIPPTNTTSRPDMILDIIGYAQDGTTVVKHITRNCALPADQQGVQLTSWTVTDSGSAAPTVPAGLQATVNADKSVNFTWNASSNSTPSGVSGYNVFVDGAKVATTGKASFSSPARAIADGDHTVTVSAFDTSTPPKESAKTSEVPFKIGETQVKPPTAPTDVAATGSTDGTGTYAVTWKPATKGTNDIAGYNIYLDDATTPAGTVDAGTATFSKTGLAIGDHNARVSAFDANGVEGPKGGPAPFTISKPGDQPPGKPTEVTGTGSTDGSGKYTVTWKPAPKGTNPIASYKVYLDGKPAGTTEGTTYTGTTTNGEHTAQISAVDDKGVEGPKSDASSPFTVSAPPTPTTDYTLKGQSKIKAANGTVPLTGAVNKVTIDSGKVTADLVLDKTSGQFQIFGFLPASADIAFSPVGQTTGSLSGTTLTTATRTIVKLPSVKIFGLEIGGGDTCQTTADIPLKSTNFTPAGGTLAGTYTLPALKGCGPLTPIISALASGPGNTVSVTLTPKS